MSLIEIPNAEQLPGKQIQFQRLTDSGRSIDIVFPGTVSMIFGRSDGYPVATLFRNSLFSVRFQPIRAPLPPFRLVLCFRIRSNSVFRPTERKLGLPPATSCHRLPSFHARRIILTLIIERNWQLVLASTIIVHRLSLRYRHPLTLINENLY